MEKSAKKNDRKKSEKKCTTTTNLWKNRIIKQMFTGCWNWIDWKRHNSWDRQQKCKTEREYGADAYNEFEKWCGKQWKKENHSKYRQKTKRLNG